MYFSYSKIELAKYPIEEKISLSWKITKYQHTRQTNQKPTQDRETARKQTAVAQISMAAMSRNSFQ